MQEGNRKGQEGTGKGSLAPVAKEWLNVEGAPTCLGLTPHWSHSGLVQPDLDGKEEGKINEDIIRQ